MNRHVSDAVNMSVCKKIGKFTYCLYLNTIRLLNSTHKIDQLIRKTESFYLLK